MAAFLYFLPGVETLMVSDGQLVSAGLFGMPPSRQMQLSKTGPAGGSGMLLRHQEEGEDGGPLAYLPDRQTWEPEFSATGKPPRYWVGVENEDKPEPDDLLRVTSLAGHAVTLNDGNPWVVPLARAYPDGCALPSTLRIGPGGLERKVTGEYAGLWADACKVWDAPAALTETEKWRIARAALAVNYRLGDAELNLLGILTTANLDSVIAALVDLPTWWEMRRQLDSKKAEAGGNPGIPAGSPSSSGVPAACPATPLPSPTAAG